VNKMNVEQIKKRTKRFLKKTPIRDEKAKRTLVTFPQWTDELERKMAVETLIILYETYKGVQYRMGILEAYREAIKTYSKRWIEWKIVSDKGGENHEFEADTENSG